MPRLFGGWDRSDADLGDLVAAGYRKGVPMGSELPARPSDASGPTFLSYAAKDALGADLDRIQIVKSWTDRGMRSDTSSRHRNAGRHPGLLKQRPVPLRHGIAWS